MVYELEDDMKPIRRYYFGDQEAARKAVQAAADQSKKAYDNELTLKILATPRMETGATTIQKRAGIEK
jgi:hypothetical protein